ncbi:hypothetical protein [Streptomyces sp. BBFR102]|uniref:hypothetical protein n=1 Tax=Streptomyces sp. BBFR102 TaxID=3448171 RepID=UPI003F535629
MGHAQRVGAVGGAYGADGVAWSALSRAGSGRAGRRGPLAVWRRWRDGARPRRDRALLARSAVVAELARDLPDEDFGEYLEDSVALYRDGSKPCAEEAEYLELVEDALDRVG